MSDRDNDAGGTVLPFPIHVPVPGGSSQSRDQAAAGAAPAGDAAPADPPPGGDGDMPQIPAGDDMTPPVRMSMPTMPDLGGADEGSFTMPEIGRAHV